MAATLHHAQAATGLKVVMVTSAVMGEGKTLTALTTSPNAQGQDVTATTVYDRQ